MGSRAGRRPSLQAARPHPSPCPSLRPAAFLIAPLAEGSRDIPHGPSGVFPVPAPGLITSQPLRADRQGAQSAARHRRIHLPVPLPSCPTHRSAAQPQVAGARRGARAGPWRAPLQRRCGTPLSERARDRISSMSSHSLKASAFSPRARAPESARTCPPSRPPARRRIHRGRGARCCRRGPIAKGPGRAPAAKERRHGA